MWQQDSGLSEDELAEANAEKQRRIIMMRSRMKNEMNPRNEAQKPRGRPAPMVSMIGLLAAVIGMTGCTQAQRFELFKNAKLDECAMKRMAEAKFNGQQGYLQAHHECHHLVMVEKFRDMRLEEQSQAVKQDLQDPLREYGACWEFVKGLYLDDNNPAMKLPERSKNGWGMKPEEAQKAMVERNARVNILPNKIAQIPSRQLIEVYELMAVNSTIGHNTTCKSPRYRGLQSAIGLEIKRREGE